LKCVKNNRVIAEKIEKKKERKKEMGVNKE
jgi:hypothetical protein